MCRHCEHLIEDKEIVHNFMALTARRLSEKRGHYIDPDRITIKIELEILEPGPRFTMFQKARVIKMLDEMHK